MGISIQQNPLHDYFIRDPETGWKAVNFNKITCQEQAEEMIRQCHAKADRLENKAIGKIFLGLGGLLVSGGIFYVAFQITALLISMVSFPLVLLPPLHNLIIFTGSLGVAATFSYHAVKKYAFSYFHEANNYGKHASFLYNQARGLKLEMPLLPTVDYWA